MTASSARTRLALLEGYLEEDAANDALRLAAYEAATEAGELACAAQLAQGALDNGREHRHAAWLHRLAHVRLAQGEDAVAHELLLRARQAGALEAIVDHDLAWLAYRQGNVDACLDLLRPHLGTAPEDLDEGLRGPLQVLWLRALHLARRHETAAQWIADHEAAGDLHGSARGVASLLAWDAGDLAAAQRLADGAVMADARDLEAQVTLAGLALMRRDPSGAQRHLQMALDLRPDEGRTQFLAGLASLQRGAPWVAREHFAAATLRMPQHIGSWHGLGWACLVGADIAGALRAWQQALPIDPAFAESQAAVGLALALSGATVAAQEHLRIAHRLDPRSVTAAYARAVLAGEADPARLPALAARLLARPGFFGGSLADDAGYAAFDVPFSSLSSVTG